MDTVLYNKEEKVRLLRANGYVVREGKVFVVKDRVPIASRSSFAFKAGRKYDIDTVFDSTIKSLFLKMNPTGGGEEEEEEGGFYTAGPGIDISGAVISLSHLGLENLTAPGEDKILFYDYSAGAVGWANFAEATSKLKISSNDTTPGYLEDKLALSHGGNVSEILEFSTIGEGADETRILQVDESRISHDNIADVSADDHHSEVHTLATTGPHTDSLPLIDLAPGTAGDIITRQANDWAVLAKGTQNHVLKMGVAYPEWGTVDWSELTGSQPAPIAHNHAWSDITSGVPTTFGGYGISDTLANLNTALSDATLYQWEADQGAVNIHGDNVVYGSAASTACVGDDARLSDARTPTAHASSHITGGGDIIATATSTAVGLLPILSNVATEYLDGTGGWSVPVGSGSMVYPGAGIALSTGSAWGTSITNNSANWNTAYDHSQSSSQAHSDYMLNTGDTVSGDYAITGYLHLTDDTQGTGASMLHLISNDGPSIKLNDTGEGHFWVINTAGVGPTLYINYDGEGGAGNVMAIKSTGEVGIGTASPGYLTEIEKDEDAQTIYFGITNLNIGTTAAPGMRINSYNNQITIISHGENHSVYPSENHIYTSGSGDKINIGGFGKRGILYTEDGSVALHFNELLKIETLVGGGKITGDLTISGIANNNQLITTDANGKLISEANLTFDGATLKVIGTLRQEHNFPTWQMKELDGNADENFQIRLSKGKFLIQQQNDAFSAASTKLTILQDGNVGIGTESPGSTLDIYSATAANINLESNAGHVILNLDAGGVGNDIRIQFQDDGANKWLQKFESGNDSMFFYGYTSGLYPITMISDGKVGINNITPSYQLDVNGTGRFTGIVTFNSHAYFGTNDVLMFGGSQEGRIWHDATDFYIKSLLHGGRVLLQGEDAGGVNRALIYADPDSGATLYSVSGGTTVTRLQTTAAGVTVTGRLSANAAVATGYAGYFFNDGGFTSRYGIGIQCGEDVPSTYNYPIKFFGGTGNGVANINYDTDSIQFAYTSDIRLKENIQDYNVNGLDIINQIQYRSFNWKKDKNKHEVYGWVADEVEEIYPDMVLIDSETGYKMIMREKLIPVMMAGIKQHYKITESHEDKIIQLEKRVKKLEDEVELLKN